MKKLFGVALLVLPLAVGSSHATGWPFNVQMSGNFYIKGTNGTAPQAGPWYLYWPLEAHFVAPAPTGYPYWPAPQGLPAMSFGGPTCPPGVPVAAAAQPAYPPPAAYAPRGMTAPQAAYPSPVMATPGVVAPPVSTAPAQAAPAPQATPQLRLPPYLQPTSYSPTGYPAQVPSYWYDR